MDEEHRYHAILELRKVSPLEKAIVNRLLRTQSPGLTGINPAQAVIYGLKDDDVAGWLAGTSLDP